MICLMKTLKYLLYLLILIAFPVGVSAQLSPGELAEVHAFLEGLSNCTKCHTAGAKVSNDKCLDCHKDLKLRIDAKKGYHASARIYRKSCVLCHSDHHGRKYQIVRFDKSKFNHSETGYTLEGAHKLAECSDCHKPSNIKDPAIRKKKQTYMGLDTRCLSCHEDIHQGTLSNDCANCHNNEKFKPASGFEHNKTKFPLKGKHQDADCAKCHPNKIQNNKEFTQFKGIKFESCKNCHTDPHDNKFGSDCSKCHVETSFRNVKSLAGFDHNQTGFPLKGKHINTDCKSCHKTSITAQLKHNRCADCHSDYHKGDFIKPDQPAPDCKDCHHEDGFDNSTFTIERHNELPFRLEGAHEATPCFACHKKSDRWQFKIPMQACSDCHQDIHANDLDSRFYPGKTCTKCHNVSSWAKIGFDHNETSFKLTGKHLSVQCSGCHPKQQVSGTQVLFKIPDSTCQACHTDIHLGQFQENEKSECSKCHSPDGWKTLLFDHNTARFKLDGKHSKVSCSKCHPVELKTNNYFVLYKTGRIRCEDCH